jgi:hypothetical protein
VSKDNCQIAGVCWRNGLLDPNESCRSCNISKSKKDWTVAGVGAACQDGNPCVVGDACGSDGKCAAGKDKDCNDGDDCTKDACDAVTGGCTNAPIAGCF